MILDYLKNKQSIIIEDDNGKMIIDSENLTYQLITKGSVYTYKFRMVDGELKIKSCEIDGMEV